MRTMAHYWKVISVCFELVFGACASGLLIVITLSCDLSFGAYDEGLNGSDMCDLRAVIRA